MTTTKKPTLKVNPELAKLNAAAACAMADAEEYLAEFAKAVGENRQTVAVPMTADHYFALHAAKDVEFACAGLADFLSTVSMYVEYDFTSVHFSVPYPANYLEALALIHVQMEWVADTVTAYLVAADATVAKLSKRPTRRERSDDLLRAAAWATRGVAAQTHVLVSADLRDNAKRLFADNVIES